MKLHDVGDLPVWRSMLFVPINVRRYVDKALGCGADAVILDLEDSITRRDKDAARALVAETARLFGPTGTDVFVRVNHPLELVVRDVEAAVSADVRGFVLPKIESASHVRLLAELVASVESRRGVRLGSTVFLVLVETPDAFPHLWDIAGAHPRNVAMALGGEDFALSTGAQPDPEVLLFPKQQVVLAASAAGIVPMGMVGRVGSYQDVEGYRQAAPRSRRFGFRGSLCIHPSVVPALNEGFSPTEEEVASAERVISAFERGEAAGRGSIEVDGKMVDIPIVQRAQQLLDLHQRFRARTPQEPAGGRMRGVETSER